MSNMPPSLKAKNARAEKAAAKRAKREERRKVKRLGLPYDHHVPSWARGEKQ